MVRINSKYYDLHDFNSLTASIGKCLSFFHLNVRSLSQHLDELKPVLSMPKIKFDFIGISESKQKVGNNFTVNVDLNGYYMYSQPSKHASSGVVLYVNEIWDHSRRDDLCTTEYDSEFLWVEIKNNKSKNILCGCIYRPQTLSLNLFWSILKLLLPGLMINIKYSSWETST